MGRIIIKNVTSLCLDNSDTIYSPGHLIIQDSVIQSIGAGAEPTEAAAEEDGATAEWIDGTDQLVLPGLVDLHFHTSVAKGYSDDLPLWEYLDEVWYPAIRALTPEDARTAALHSYATALKSGTTTVNDMFRQLPALASAATQIGIRAVLSNDIALPEHGLDSVADNVAAFRECDGAADGRVRVWMGLEWLPLSDEALLRELAAAKKELGVGLHLHLCESRSEVADAATRFGGRTPTQLAHAAGLLGPTTVAAHCVHLTDDDIALLAETGTHVSINAGSNAKLGNGVAPLLKLKAAGVNCGIGVDACECHNSTDMFESMKLTSFLNRALHQDPALAPPSQVLRMATRNGAKALGIDAGVLQKGMKADVILLDLKKDMMFTPLLKAPLEARRKQLESHLVFGCNGTAVSTVIVDGRVVVRDRVVLGIDEESVRQEMDRVFERLVETMGSKTVKRAKN